MIITRKQDRETEKHNIERKELMEAERESYRVARSTPESPMDRNYWTSAALSLILMKDNITLYRPRVRHL